MCLSNYRPSFLPHWTFWDTLSTKQEENLSDSRTSHVCLISETLTNLIVEICSHRHDLLSYLLRGCELAQFQGSLKSWKSKAFTWKKLRPKAGIFDLQVFLKMLLQQYSWCIKIVTDHIHEGYTLAFHPKYVFGLMDCITLNYRARNFWKSSKIQHCYVALSRLWLLAEE